MIAFNMLFLLFARYSYSAPVRDAEEMNLKDSVKLIVEKRNAPNEPDSISLSSEIPGNRPYTGQELHFNIDGYITKEYRCSSETEPFLRSVYKFDEEGRWEKTEKYNHKGTIERRYEYSYLDCGRIGQIEMYDSKTAQAPKEKSIIVYSQDKEVRKDYSSTGDLSGKSLKYLDDNGFVVKFEFFDYIMGYERLTQTEVYKYDEEGNRMESWSEFGRVEKTRAEYDYDEEGRMIDYIVYDEKNRVRSRIVWQFDKNGNEISQRIYGPEEILRREVVHEYEYDARNNWIQKNKIVNNVNEAIYERGIEYYN